MGAFRLGALALFATRYAPFANAATSCRLRSVLLPLASRTGEHPSHQVPAALQANAIAREAHMPRIRAALLLVCGLIGSLAAAQAQPNAPLRVGYQTGDINVQLMYAVNADLFAKKKIDAKLTPFPAGPAMLPALAAAEIDIAWMGEFPVVTGYSNGMGIEIFMMERIDTTNVRLVANAATGAQTVADLKGRKIGVSVGSTSHHHLLRALAQAGLKQDEVTLVNLAPANMPPAYLAGQIDAALTWEPNIGLIERAAGKTIATTESLKMITGGVWVVRSAFAKDNPDTMQRFLAAWVDAMAAYRADPRNTRQYEAKRVNLSADEFDALIARQNARHPSFEELLTADFMGPPGKELDSRLMKHLQGIGAFLVGEKRITAPPSDWSKILNTQPIQTFLAASKK
jgi:taurine transport system substrate-binding protein